MTRQSAQWTGGRVRGGYRTAVLGVAASLSIGLFAAPSALWALERGQEPIRVTLQLRDDESLAPLLGALIEVSGQARRYVTGVDGQATVDVPAGAYVITVRKGGYATLTHELEVVRPEEVTLSLRKLADVEAGLPATLLVRVREAGTERAIEGAAVSLGDEETRMTDGSGNVQFSTLSGPARINVEMIGYADRSEPVSVSPDGITFVDLAMAVDAVVLPPIEVEVRSRFLLANGVYRRIDRGQVMRMVSREQLEQFPVSFLSDALANVPGVTVDRRTVGETRVFGPARGDPNGCELQVFVDGIPTDMNIDAFSPEMVELAEIYWGLRTPMQYRGVNASNCGVVLLWMRRGGE